jgi:hypothetical protein
VSSLTYAPLGDRTPFTGDTVWSRFTVTWNQTLNLLDRELEMLGAEDVVLEVDVEPSAIRLDGGLRADRRVNSPGVRLRFDSDHGSLSYATDRFVRPYYSKGMDASWRHNVYAIAKGLEALRLVDRYGIAGHGEQYRGYLALETGIGIASGMTQTDAVEIILRAADLSHLLHMNPTTVTATQVKRARAATHPDVNGGDRTQYNLVDQAVSVLDRAGKIRQDALT